MLCMRKTKTTKKTKENKTNYSMQKKDLQDCLSMTEIVPSVSGAAAFLPVSFAEDIEAVRKSQSIVTV